jgi:hypothetical protein
MPAVFLIQVIFYTPLFFVLYHSMIATEQLRMVVMLFLVRAIMYFFFMLPFMSGMASLYALMNLFFDFAFVIVFIMVFNQPDLSIISRALLIMFALLNVRSLLIFDDWFFLVVQIRQWAFIIGMIGLTYQILDTTDKKPSEFL